MEQEAFDLASLDSFRADLVAAGFEPVPSYEHRLWRGPIHPAFSGLTDAQIMDIALDVGWPYRPPGVFVQGLNTNHCMLNGFVCLWREGDATRHWETVEGLFSRIDDWCARAKNGWQDDDLPFDAYLNFMSKLKMMATFDFESLRTSIDSRGDLKGIVTTKPRVLNLQRGPATSSKELRGLWLRVGHLQAPPPRNLAELSQHLNDWQRTGLERALSRRRAPACLRPSGGVDVILFAWERRERTDLLIMALKGIGDNVEAAVLVAEPNDERTLRLRAGPDSGTLNERKAVLFGVGALGGHVAVTLAKSGIGTLKIVDRDLLSPGNVVRHVAGHDHVGKLKVDAVQAVVGDYAPWTKVESVAPQAHPAAPGEITQLVADVDIVIDATGNEAFVYPLAQVAEALGKQLVSGALYRGGFIGRVQRKALNSDTPINCRSNSASYPEIPVGDSELDFAEPDLGCSSPVNNAPPASILACAAPDCTGHHRCPDRTNGT